ncbi:uncharacterized protein LOC114306434 isoform X2 [Camellia sinensis]|uniref:uncharacterized protein LOC114306434 isoform X2 n=1 Tax=Camellia sinensis TaxID=4442 RepID=UPI0010356E7E|nr:uncharacterized protein LOC114306434 isoform X2 [Camellia sinensis]
MSKIPNPFPLFHSRWFFPPQPKIPKKNPNMHTALSFLSFHLISSVSFSLSFSSAQIDSTPIKLARSTPHRSTSLSHCTDRSHRTVRMKMAEERVSPVISQWIRMMTMRKKPNTAWIQSTPM